MNRDYLLGRVSDIIRRNNNIDSEDLIYALELAVLPSAPLLKADALPSQKVAALAWLNSEIKNLINASRIMHHELNIPFNVEVLMGSVPVEDGEWSHSVAEPEWNSSGCAGD